jgi:hypothetical protein
VSETKGSTFFLKIYEEPLIYVIASGWSAVSGLKRCLADAGSRGFHLLVVPYWDVKSLVSELMMFGNTVEAISNQIKVWFMCPTEDDVDLIRSRGGKAIHSHQNAFIDENIFTLDYALGDRSNAIHNAAMVRWKRHNLAWGVRDVSVVTYRHHPSDDDQIIRKYKFLKFTNMNEDGSVNFLDSKAICRLLCASSCGLILSAKEGANFASGEYQFCGLPVISTPSAGGRAAFFDSKSTIIVQPVAELVERAVEFAIRNPLDPNEIRARAIQKSITHRERLLDWMSNVVGEKLHSRADMFARLPQFKDKLRESVPCV